MLGLPNPYVILAAAGLWIASLIGAGLFWGHHVSLGYEVSISKQKIQAGTVLAGALQKVRDKENADAENAREIDAKHASEMAAVNSSRNDFAQRVRDLERRRLSCGSPSTPSPVNPVVGKDVATGSDNGSGSIDSPSVRLRDVVLELQAYARACHSWAESVGR